MKNIREILLQADRRADYTSQLLSEQADEVDHSKLTKIINRVQTRVAVLTHAHDVLVSGVCSHPMQAFLHASECITNVDGSRISDDDFYSLLANWCKLCDSAPSAQRAYQQAFDLFAERFMGRRE